MIRKYPKSIIRIVNAIDFLLCQTNELLCQNIVFHQIVSGAQINGSFPIAINGVNFILSQSFIILRRTKGSNFPSVIPVQSFKRTEPHSSCLILIKRKDTDLSQPVFNPQMMEINIIGPGKGKR